jgi:hypothetical protein
MGIAHAFPYPHVIPHSDGSCPVDEWMDLGVVGAVILVVQRDKVLALEAAGYSDLDTKSQCAQMGENATTACRYCKI